MEPNTISGLYEEALGPGMRFHALSAFGFKTDLLLVQFLMPLGKETLYDTALLPTVLSRGCRRYPTTEGLAERLDDLYDMELGAKTVTDSDTRVIGFSRRTLERECTPDGEDLFPEGNALLSDVLFDPLVTDGGFSPAFTATEQKNMIDGIRAAMKNKTSYASRLCREGMWGKDVRGYGGDEEGASRVTPQSLYRTYRDMLENAPVECWYIGKRDPVHTAAGTKRLLEPLAALRNGKNGFYPFPHMECPKPGKGVRYLRRDLPTEQSMLCVGYRNGVLRGGDAYCASAVFEEMFGGGQSSLLFTALREKAGLCYDCSSVYDSRMGALAVFCGIDRKNRTAAERGIAAVLSSVCDGDFRDEDLDAAKRSMITSIRMRGDHPGALLRWYASMTLDGLRPDPAEEIERISAVTREDVRCAAQSARKRVSVFICGTEKNGYAEPEEDFYDSRTTGL